ncbi:hypothetical protein [Miltoncostaea marina]|uniref:hypothetical protein n=1 Tax=Miltoncostaea marina TaxID=2843215 RepID=UPI001C3E52AC|nr:hypothetical protein [Miltoncostaea marina]
MLTTTRTHRVGWHDPGGTAREGAAEGVIELAVVEPPADVGPAPPPHEGADALARWRERMREAGALLALAPHEAAPLLVALGDGVIDPDRIERLLWDERVLTGAGPDGAHVRDWLAMAARRDGARVLDAVRGLARAA